MGEKQLLFLISLLISPAAVVNSNWEYYFQLSLLCCKSFLHKSDLISIHVVNPDNQIVYHNYNYSWHIIVIGIFSSLPSLKASHSRERPVCLVSAVSLVKTLLIQSRTVGGNELLL